MRRNLNR